MNSSFFYALCMSLWEIWQETPAFPSAAARNLDTVTERCFPPVQPMEMTRLLFPSSMYWGTRKFTISVSLSQNTLLWGYDII